MNRLPILDLPELRDRYGLFEGDGPCVLFLALPGAASAPAKERLSASEPGSGLGTFRGMDLRVA